MNRLAILALAAASLTGCAADFNNPVQTGKDRFTLYGNEAEAAGPAQAFCKEHGFGWAETDRVTHDGYGFHTTFFCMRPGKKLVSIARCSCGRL